jgi:hypothetical protein
VRSALAAERVLLLYTILLGLLITDVAMTVSRRMLSHPLRTAHRASAGAFA